ncbi:MAG: hypothetical protein MRY83_17690 [Flavobacteriales bacterium]|nr:hypothetical protein [Flavobacteriales bacterium]
MLSLSSLIALKLCVGSPVAVNARLIDVSADTLKYLNFDRQQELRWQELESQWYVNVVQPIKKRRHVKFNCTGDCEGVMYDLQLSISEHGSIESMKVSPLYEDCSKIRDRLTEETKAYLQSLDFSAFSNKVVICHFGSILKC